MYPIPPTETLIETKVCRHCQASFPITDKDLEFYEKVSPVFNGKKYSIPSPTLCPDCRQQRRLSFRNERKLYKRKCDATNKDIVSIYSPDKPFKVYHQDYWWSDAWDPMSYGCDFDLGRSFFEQFGELSCRVPKPALYIDQSMEGSSYCNYGLYCKGCYLCVNCYAVADSFYSISCWPNDGISTAYGLVDSDNCADSSYIYESLDLERCYKCFYSRLLEDCTDCYFSEGLGSCSYCIGCINLQNKKHYILNEQVTEDVFNQTLHSLLTNERIRAEFLKQFQSLCENEPHRASYISNCEDSTGDFLSDNKNVHSSFLTISTENGKYSYTSGYLTKNMYDGMNAGGESDILYEAQHVHYIYRSAFLLDVDHCQDVYLSELCDSCKFCFGCAWLRHKEYCILNKQYTKEQYEELVPKIIEHMMTPHPSPLLGGEGVIEWWEFFPSSLSPFGYNETVAQEYYPLEPSSLALLPRGEGGKVPSPSGRGLGWGQWIFHWSDYEAPFPKVEKIITVETRRGVSLLDDITKVPDDILNWAIECEVTKKPFRIIKQELEFYRKHNLPIPRRHPDQRHLDRMALRNPRKLFERVCNCPNCEENHRAKGIALDDSNSILIPLSSEGQGEWRSQRRCPGVEGLGVRRIKMITTYAPERPERVYCEVCYNREVVG